MLDMAKSTQRTLDNVFRKQMLVIGTTIASKSTMENLSKSLSLVIVSGSSIKVGVKVIF